MFGGEATGGKTDAEVFAEHPSKIIAAAKPVKDTKTVKSSCTVGGCASGNKDKVLLSLQEAQELLGVNITHEDTLIQKKEAELKTREADEGGICSCFPFLNCSLIGHKGILKGLKKSLPRRQHFIQYWRKQISNRVNASKDAIVVDGNADLNISYRELDEFSNSVAFNLKHLKFSQGFVNENPKGELVIGVCHPACYEYVVVLLGILKLGAAILPISVELPAERIAEIIKLTRPVLLITSAQEDELIVEVEKVLEIMEIDVDITLIDDLWDMLTQKGGLDKSKMRFKDYIRSAELNKPYPPLWQRSVAISVVPSDVDELIALSYDSRAIFNRIKWEDHFFVYFSSEYVLLPPSFETVDNIADVLTALTIGVTLVAYQNATDVYIPEQLFSYCQTYKIRRLKLWPSLLRACTTAMQLFEFYAPQVRTVRYWFCVGGIMRSEQAEVFFELMHPLAQLVHMYRFEDCCGCCAFHSYETLVNSKDRSFYSRLPVGYPVPNMDIYLLDHELNPVKDGELGEIYISGVQLPRAELSNLPSHNYMKNPFCRHKDRKYMVRTFDYGRIKTRSNGTRVLIHEMTRSRHFYIDDQIVWLQSIEMYLKRLTNLVKVGHCICYRPNEDDQLILAFCIPVSKQITYQVVENELRNILSQHTVPEVVIVDSIPMFHDTGIVDENGLLAIYQERRAKRQVFDDWSKLQVTCKFKLRASKILSYELFVYLGTPIDFLVENCWDKPYLAIRRATVTKAAFIVKELHRNRYPIYIDDFIYAESLFQIAEFMVEARKERGYCNRSTTDEVIFLKNRYKLEILVNSHRTSVCSMMAKCFTMRGQLDYYAEVCTADMRKYFDTTWPIWVSKKLSLLIRRKREKNLIVGAVLNINWKDEFKLITSNVPTEVAYKLELIHFLETGLTDEHFPQDKTHVIQVCYIGLDTKSLSNTEIHGLTDKAVRTMLAFGKVKGFEAIVILIYDYFALDICVNNYAFKVAKQCQVNTFEASDGSKPYALCPDSMVASICWKLYNKVVENSNHRLEKSRGKTIYGLINTHKKP